MTIFFFLGGHFVTIFFILGGHFVTADILQRNKVEVVQAQRCRVSSVQLGSCRVLLISTIPVSFFFSHANLYFSKVLVLPFYVKEFFTHPIFFDVTFLLVLLLLRVTFLGCS